MRLRRVFSSLLACAVALATVAAAPATADAGGPHYYLALGDSLSRGYMPGPGDTDQGYVDDLYATLHAKDPSLELVKLGCSGETTTTMIRGGRCTDRYPVGSSQLAAAEQFLHAHAGAVSYLTIDIGANDVASCAEGGSIDFACVTKGITTIAANLNTILDRLVAAAGESRPQSVGMTYYDPFLAAWLGGAQGKVTAIASVGLLELVNAAEATLFGLHGYEIADVATAFHSTDFVTQRTVPGYGILPVNVAYVCQYTYACGRNNIHPSAAGYELIAEAFRRRLA